MKQADTTTKTTLLLALFIMKQADTKTILLLAGQCRYTVIDGTPVNYDGG